MPRSIALTARPAVLASVLIVLAAAAFAAARADVLTAGGGLPPHIVGQFSEPLNFQQLTSGESLVFDRRGHSVYLVDRRHTGARKIVEIGNEEGRIIEPTAFDLEPGGTFVVADAPNGRERIQIFSPTGARIGGFTLPGRTTSRVTIGSLVLNGIGSLQYTGRSIVINQPERGTLITEYGLAGTPVRTFGALRKTGHEQDRELHLALNTGLPLVDPKGGFYFVFQTGVPLFRKYDRSGELVFERHVEGRELDDFIERLPAVWPRRNTAEGAIPLVTPTVRTAAVDPDGQLWIAFTLPYTYVYDPDGDKIRAVQFSAAGQVAPTSLFFPSRGRVLVTPGCYEFDVR